MPYIVTTHEYYTAHQCISAENINHDIYMHKCTAEHAAGVYLEEAVSLDCWPPNYKLKVIEVYSTDFEEVYGMTKDEITEWYGEPYVVDVEVHPTEHMLELLHRKVEIDLGGEQ